MNKITKPDIFGVQIQMTNCVELINLIENAIRKNSQISITYVTQHSLNLLFHNEKLQEIFARFTMVHQDGIGVYLAAKILYGKKALAYRLTGSDFYVYAKDYFAGKRYRLFFFGDTSENLAAIPEKCPGLNVAGLQDGYTYRDETVLQLINASGCDILFVGLGCPKQETWVTDNREKIKAPVVICVGDGLKIFSGNKARGPLWAQRFCLEWFFRFLHEPARLWQRYFLGIPLFFIRVFRIKFFLRKNVR
jgi:N-acetylglucosaminyldiphosphoundecaprenol N-acetyl-beta-D-mannosaminyltransferase